jgi:hypothetical protein
MKRRISQAEMRHSLIDARRHGRACSGHPRRRAMRPRPTRLSLGATWMPGTSPGMTETGVKPLTAQRPAEIFDACFAGMTKLHAKARP